MILLNEAPRVTAVNEPLSPLNAVWLGLPDPPLCLPQWGQILLVFPLEETPVSCAGITIAADRYLFLLPAPQSQSVTLERLKPGDRVNDI